MKPYRKKSSKTTPAILVLLLIAAAVYWLQTHGPQATSPSSALAKARALIEQKSHEQASTLLAIAERDPKLRNWVLLERGKSFQLTGKFDQAIRTYRAIDELSPSSLDARLQLFELQSGSYQASELQAVIEELDSLFRVAERTDLIRRLYIIGAEQQFKNQDIEHGYKLLSKVRDSFRRTNESARALELRDLYVSDEELSSEQLRVEAERFLSENLPERALSLIERALEKTPEDSSPAFQLQMIEEKILRRLKRHQDADRLLSVISADAPPEIADAAVLKLSKNAWNIDHHDNALTFINGGLQRFPNSTLRAEMLYIKGRLLEETQQFEDAKETYTLASNESQSPLIAARSLLRIAWMYYLSENYPYAASFFQQTADYIEKNSKHYITNRELREVYEEALFWEIATASELNKEETALLKRKTTPLDSAIKKLSPAGLPTYYTVAAESLLEAKGHSFETKSKQTDCAHSFPASVDQLIQVLAEGDNIELVKHEINWALSKEKDPLAAAKKVSALSHFRLSSEAIDLGRTLLLQIQSSPDSLQAACATHILSASYPIDFQKSVEQHAKQNGLKPSLIYAVTHTESSFNPTALSSAKAQGLMQLMTKTALQEGLAKNEDVFDPSVNIRLGAKHLRRLLNVYNNEQLYSIAAYNAGGAAVNRWKTRYKKIPTHAWVELIGYPETKRYVKKVVLAQYMYDFFLER